jgi:hypothetical protein
MDILRPVRAFDRTQQRHRSLAVPLAVVKSSPTTAQAGMLIAYHSFFLAVPPLLVFATVLGCMFKAAKLRCVPR